MAVNKVVFGAVSIMDISDSTVTADKLAKGVTAYDKAGEKITGTMESSSAPTLQEKTVTPSTAAQSITADNGYDGLSKVTVNGDANLTSDNIKSGTSIFGVTGSYAGSSPNLQSKSVTYTSNGTATVMPDSGYDGLSSVDVTVDVASGGGVETCTLTTSVGKAPFLVHGTIYAYSGDTLITITSKGTYYINKNSLIYIDGASSMDNITGLEKLYYGYGISVCNVTSDIATYKFDM